MSEEKRALFFSEMIINDLFVTIPSMKSAVTEIIQVFVLLIRLCRLRHTPLFPPYLETELICSGPVRIFSMIHRVTEKRTFRSCCGR